MGSLVESSFSPTEDFHVKRHTKNLLLLSIDIKELNKLTRGVPTVETSGSQLGKEEQGPITANLLLFLL